MSSCYFTCRGREGERGGEREGEGEGEGERGGEREGGREGEGEGEKGRVRGGGRGREYSTPHVSWPPDSVSGCLKGCVPVQDSSVLPCCLS